jgi:uncharacterized protein YceH (UPF0502 family)
LQEPFVDDRLTNEEIRVLGSLIEKEMTTPEYYPLSLNALMNACNQSSNREPVVLYEEATVATAVESMRRRSLARAVQQSGSRVTKYRHLVGETLGITGQQAALMCVMMLRGPQTLNELKTRGTRLFNFESLDDVETALNQLLARESPSLATRLERRPGQKEVRYAHLLAGEPIVVDTPEQAAVRTDSAVDRIGVLEHALEEVRKEVADLRAQLDTFRKQFE